MDKLLINFVFIICCGFLLLPQSMNALRIKRSDNLANSTAVDTIFAVANQSTLPIPLPINVTPTEVGKVVAAGKANVIPVPIPFTPPVVISEESPLELTERINRSKRRMSFIDDSFLPKIPRHAHKHSGNASPPYVYFNKMISPDGKQELKEFQLLAPNVVIESLQHDMNYGPVPEMGGVLILNAENGGRMHDLAKFKHHRKPKSSIAMPPFLYMLQQMLQPNLNLDVESQMQRNRIDTPIYQFLDNAVDNGQRIEFADGDFPSQKIELNKEEKPKAANEMPNSKDDELIVSCPIHHEHIAGKNGETIDDDVVLVNECHVV